MNNKSLCCVFRHVLLHLCPDSVLPAELPAVASDTKKVPAEKAVWNGAWGTRACHSIFSIIRARWHNVCLPQLFFMQLLVGLIQQVCVYGDFDKHRNAFKLTHTWTYEKGGMSFIVKVAFSPIKMKHFSLVSCSGWFPPYRTQWNHFRYEQTSNTIYCHKIRALKKSVVLSVTGNELF